MSCQRRSNDEDLMATRTAHRPEVTDRDVSVGQSCPIALRWPEMRRRVRREGATLERKYVICARDLPAQRFPLRSTFSLLVAIPFVACSPLLDAGDTTFGIA